MERFLQEEETLHDCRPITCRLQQTANKRSKKQQKEKIAKKQQQNRPLYKLLLSSKS